jgi:hypothetical protein
MYLLTMETQNMASLVLRHFDMNPPVNFAGGGALNLTSPQISISEVMPPDGWVSQRLVAIARLKNVAITTPNIKFR